jgi:hypothetical protein
LEETKMPATTQKQPEFLTLKGAAQYFDKMSPEVTDTGTSPPVALAAEVEVAIERSRGAAAGTVDGGEADRGDRPGSS